MFTSRAEYRILLRQDDADKRLTERGYKLGLASKERYDLMLQKYTLRDELYACIKDLSVKPAEINSYLQERGTTPIKQSVKLIEVLKRPQVDINSLLNQLPALESKICKYGALVREVIESTEILIKYAGYIEREKMLAEKIKRLEKVVIPNDIDFDKILSLSTEARQKLTKINPQTLGQASRINGVSPADISVLLVFLGR